SGRARQPKRHYYRILSCLRVLQYGQHPGKPLLPRLHSVKERRGTKKERSRSESKGGTRWRNCYRSSWRKHRSLRIITSNPANRLRLRRSGTSDERRSETVFASGFTYFRKRLTSSSSIFS